MDPECLGPLLDPFLVGVRSPVAELKILAVLSSDAVSTKAPSGENPSGSAELQILAVVSSDAVSHKAPSGENPSGSATVGSLHLLLGLQWPCHECRHHAVAAVILPLAFLAAA